MALRLEDVTSSGVIVKIVQEKVSGIPEDILPSGYTTITSPSGDDSGVYYRTTGTNGMAPVTGYNSASGLEDMSGLDAIPYKAINVRRHFVIDAKSVRAMKNTSDPSGQTIEIARVTNSIERITSKIRGTLLGSIYSMLNGTFRYSASGQVLDPNGSGGLAHDFGIPAGHKDQLDVFGVGDIIGTVWSNAASTPISDIERIQAAAKKETGLPLTTAMYGSSLHGYFLSNTALQQTINGNPNFSSAFASGAIPQGWLGIDRWIPIAQAFAESSTSTDTNRDYIDFFTANALVLTPDVTSQWYTLYESAVEVPQALGIGGSAMDALDNASTVFGPFGYSTIDTDPFSIKMILGSSWFPALLNPKAIYHATVAGF